MKKSFLALMVTLPWLAACGFVNTGPIQAVSVETLPDGGARCELVNQKGTWVVHETPGIANIRKSQSDLSVQCTRDDGWVGGGDVVPKRLGAPFGSKTVAGLFGAEVDAITGASYRYPNQITVVMTRTDPDQFIAPGSISTRGGSIGSQRRGSELVTPGEFNERLMRLCNVNGQMIASTPSACQASGGTMQ